MPELFTIGYEGTSRGAVLRTLVYHDIQTLVDIRELPQSRKPGLSKTALGLAAHDFGIQYANIRELGTPRDIRYRRKIDRIEAAASLGASGLSLQPQWIGGLLVAIRLKAFRIYL